MKIQLLVKSAFGQASVSTNPSLTQQDRFYFRLFSKKLQDHVASFHIQSFLLP